MDSQAVVRAVERAGLGPVDLDDVEIVGADPDTAFSPPPRGEGAAVARLLTGVAARRLWEIKTGRRRSRASTPATRRPP